MEPHDDKQYWFVAIVTPNTEKKAVEKMDKLVQYWVKEKIVEKAEGVTSYVPIQKEVRYRPSTRKRVEVEKVLTSCYIFIRCSNAIRYKIASEAKFILHFMMNSASKTESGRRDFARIPDVQMENFMRMVGDAENEVTIAPPVSMWETGCASRPAVSLAWKPTSVKSRMAAPSPSRVFASTSRR